MAATSFGIRFCYIYIYIFKNQNPEDFPKSKWVISSTGSLVPSYFYSAILFWSIFCWAIVWRKQAAKSLSSLGETHYRRVFNAKLFFFGCKLMLNFSARTNQSAGPDRLRAFIKQTWFNLQTQNHFSPNKGWRTAIELSQLRWSNLTTKPIRARKWLKP